MSVNEILSLIFMGLSLLGLLVLLFLCLFFEYKKQVRQSQFYLSLTDEQKHLIDIYRSIK